MSDEGMAKYWVHVKVADESLVAGRMTVANYSIDIDKESW